MDTLTLSPIGTGPIAVNGSEWNAPDCFPPEPGEYMAALAPASASVNARRWWTGTHWSHPYMADWPEPVKQGIRAELSSFLAYWRVAPPNA